MNTEVVLPFAWLEQTAPFQPRRFQWYLISRTHAKRMGTPMPTASQNSLADVDEIACNDERWCWLSWPDVFPLHEKCCKPFWYLLVVKGRRPHGTRQPRSGVGPPPLRSVRLAPTGNACLDGLLQNGPHHAAECTPCTARFDGGPDLRSIRLSAPARSYSVFKCSFRSLPPAMQEGPGTVPGPGSADQTENRKGKPLYKNTSWRTWPRKQSSPDSGRFRGQASSNFQVRSADPGPGTHARTRAA